MLRRRMVMGVTGLALCAAGATAQQPPRPNNVIELPAMHVTRIQTTVWVPCNCQPLLLGETTIVDRSPREGWSWVGVGPHRILPVFFAESPVTTGPTIVGGVDTLVLLDYDKIKEEKERALHDPEKILSPLDLARRALKSGDKNKAIEKYTIHLEGAPRDAAAMREIALALLVDGKTADAVEMMTKAYRQDPNLAKTPIAADLLKGESAAFIECVSTAVANANRKKTKDAWLTALVLSQANDRPAATRRIFEKAKAAGLDEHVAAQFQAALHPTPDDRQTQQPPHDSPGK